MARFVFSLDSVLRHRKHLEQEAQRDLAKLQGQMVELQSAMAELEKSVKAGMNDLRENRLLGELNVAFLTGHRRYMLVVQRQAMTLGQKMTLLQRQIEEAQKQLVAAAQQRQIMEKLRDRQKQRWAAEQNRKQLAELDDVSMRIAAWKALGVEQNPYRTEVDLADNNMERLT